MSPRPILKSLPTAPPMLAKPSFRVGRVHFPPTPELSATYFAHSAKSYDRSAIVVSPNECVLPRRNCPDRTYVLSEGKGEARLLKSVETEEIQIDNEDADFDDTPVPEDRQGPEGGDYFSVTPSSLTPDMTWSESDDSDGLMSPPCNEVDPNHGLPPIPMVHLAVPDDTHDQMGPSSPEHVRTALAFLPHAPPSVYERKRSPSPRGRDRKDRAHSFSDTENGRVPPIRWSRRTSSFTSDVPPDAGCLGGF